MIFRALMMGLLLAGLAAAALAQDEAMDDPYGATPPYQELPAQGEPMWDPLFQAPTSPPVAPAEAPDAPSVSPPPEAPVLVLMQSLAFQPQELVVATGTTVVWQNLDPFEHSVTADDGSFDSGLLGQGATYALTFTYPGTYFYFCLPHGSPGGNGMAGWVIVN